MQVRKRNGAFESVELSKIESSLKRYCGDLPNIDVYRIASKTVGGLVDGVTTLELDMLSVRTAKDLIIDDPVYAKVAARILANVIQKEVSGLDIQSFSQSIELGHQQGLIADATHKLVLTNKRKLNAAIKNERDWNMEFHGLQTVYDRYLLKHPTALRPSGGGDRMRAVIETPQYFFMRVACGLADDAFEAIEMYNLLSSLEYMCSTPTLFNSGTTHSQMSSCYLNDSPLDSLESIYKSYSDVALLSKFAGGIGLSLSRIRGRDSLIKGTNGKSNGLVPWAHTLSSSVASVNQGGKRKGAAAIYLETHHPDIMQFLELKDNSGEREQRAYNLNLANWVSDLFMKRVKTDEMWSLFDPTVAPELVDLYGDAYEKRYLELEAAARWTERTPARRVYARMMRTLAETGNGWMTFKDTCNRRGNQVNDSAGTMIHLSNLCVAPETMLLTNQGHVPISSLENQDVSIWNGEEFSPVTVRKTGENQAIIRIVLSNGATLDCTPYHKFYVYVGKGYSKKYIEKRAIDLIDGDRVLKTEFPLIDHSDIDFSHAYTHGFFCGDGTYNCNFNPAPFVALHAEKKELVPHLELRSGSGIEDAGGRLIYQLPLTLEQKFVVPDARFNLNSRLQWLAGLFDADGTVSRNGSNQSLQVGSIVPEFLNSVRLMLQTLGVDAKVTKMREAGSVQIRATEKVYLTQPMFRLLINSNDTQALLQLGLRCRRLKIVPHAPQRAASQFTKVVAIVDNNRVDDTYCLTEPKRHMAVFNGILTGQCTEILEATSSGQKTQVSRDVMNQMSSQNLIDDSLNVIGFDRKSDTFTAVSGAEVAVCNLGSINLARNYIKHGKLDKDKLRKNVSTAVKYLDRVINRNFYPIAEAESSNMRWRPVGLGLMGLADFFMQLRIPYDSEQAIKLSGEIQEEIYFQALKTSCDLAKEIGPHRDFNLTRAAKGDLQFDLAGVTPSDIERWDALKAEIKEHGLRNSLLIAIAPTATISHICGVEEAIEPIKSNLLKRETLSGEFIAINKYLVEDLRKLGRWNAETINQLKVDEGSVANIAGLPPELYANYKTVWEMSMKSLIAHAVSRGAFIDQSHSLNMFIDLNKYPEDKRIGVLSSLYMHAWESGIKTTYYFRSRAATRIQQTTTVRQSIADVMETAPETPEVCESCT